MGVAFKEKISVGKLKSMDRDMIRAILFAALVAAPFSSMAEEIRPVPAERPLTFEEHCEAVLRALNHPFIDRAAKMAILEKGRNDGCFGRPPTQDVKR